MQLFSFFFFFSINSYNFSKKDKFTIMLFRNFFLNVKSFVILITFFAHKIIFNVTNKLSIRKKGDNLTYFSHKKY